MGAEASALTSRDVEEWSAETVASKLGELGGAPFAGYGQAVIEHGVDGRMIFTLTADDLEEMGVIKTLHKRRLLSEIDRIKARQPTFWSNVDMGCGSTALNTIIIDDRNSRRGGDVVYPAEEPALTLQAMPSAITERQYELGVSEAFDLAPSEARLKHTAAPQTRHSTAPARAANLPPKRRYGCEHPERFPHYPSSQPDAAGR